MNIDTNILMICTVAAIFLLAVIARHFKKSRGRRGERKVARLLDRLPKDRYFVINDLMLLSEGRSSQIDHIVVSEFGVFIIETKTFSGKIYGLLLYLHCRI